MNLFTYGTLRPAGANYDVIEADVVAHCEAFHEARLFATPDGNPILVEGEPAYPVKGSLLVLPDNPALLRRLDGLLGVDHPRSPLQRVQRRIMTERGDDMAFVYVCKSDEIHQVIAEGVEITEGDWFLWEAEEREE